MEPLIILLLLAGLFTGYMVARLQIRREWAQLPERISRAISSEEPDLSHPFQAPLLELKHRLKRLESELANAETKFEALMEAVDEGVLCIDGEGTELCANSRLARLLGVAGIGSKPGRSLAEILRDHEAVETVKQLLADSRGGSRTLELGYPRRPMVVQAVRIPGMDCALVTVRDLSEMRRLERSRQELIANISHELRTPLTNIKALVETLRDGAMEDPNVSKEFLERVEVEVDGLSQLVRELLELSLIESGQAPLQIQDTQVADIVEEVVSRLALQARRAGIDLNAELPANMPPVKADPSRLQQVLVNLVHNAIKFTPSGGSVRVGAELQGPNVHVWVADTGIGIAPEDLPRIFERLYKVDRSRSSTGTGLGLAIAKHIVRAHGGEIWAESQQGKGSVFHFTVPVTEEMTDAKGKL